MLLLCAPLGILAAKLNWGPVAVFCLNFGALVPLALILGEVTTACTSSAGSLKRTSCRFLESCMR